MVLLFFGGMLPNMSVKRGKSFVNVNVSKMWLMLCIMRLMVTFLFPSLIILVMRSEVVSHFKCSLCLISL